MASNSTSNPVTSTKNIQWIIRNVTRDNIEKYTRENRLSSAPFNINLGDEITKWRFLIYADEEWLQFYLREEKIRKYDFGVKFSFAMGDMIKKFVDEHAKKFQGGFGWGWHHVIKLDQLFLEQNRYVDQLDRLVVNCTITLTKNKDAIKQLQTVELDRPCEEYRDFLNEETFSDCSFTTSDKVKVPGHRIILTKRSSGFKKILEEMKAQKRKTLVFANIDSETLKAVMSFIYTGNVTLSQNSASVIRVLKAAIKFEIDDLKSLCIETLINQISSDNVFELLEVAVDKDLEELEAESLKYIMSRYHQLNKSPDWPDVTPAIRELICDAFSGLVQSITLEGTL